jgi:hypothetical protein
MIKAIPLSFLFLVATFMSAQPENFPQLTGPYLGQKPPGREPVLFAPGTISRDDYFEHSAALFSPDGKEVFWAAKANDQREYKIYSMKMTDGKWSRPEVAAFCQENKYYQSLFLSPDGKRLYFTDGSDWLFVEKRNGIWSAPFRVSPKITAGADANLCSVTRSGSVYFIKRPEHDGYVSKTVKEDDGPPTRLDDHINCSATRENSVYVAPDERYMIIEATKDAALCELFISFKNDRDAWSERIKLPIAWGRLPSVTPDGKYLFFFTRDGIHWVSTEIIEALRAKARRVS